MSESIFEMQPAFHVSEGSDINFALNQIMNHVLQNMNSNINYDRKLFCTTIDNFLIYLRNSNRNLINNNLFHQEINLVLTTDLHSIGGHSRIARTFNSDSVINYYVLTDIFNQNHDSSDKYIFLDDFVGKGNYTILTNGSAIEKLFGLINLINTIQPKYISCFNHQFDVVSILAALFFIKCRRFYYHHCDHTISIGATIKEFVHIDTNDYLNLICKKNILDSFTLPLALSKSTTSDSIFTPSAPISFISVGTFHKYELNDYQSPIFYPKIIIQILLNQNTLFFHVGNMPESFLTLINSLLINNHINPERFHYLGDIPNLTEYFSLISNKIFIPSFPRAGGLTYIEFLSLSTPILYNKITSCKTISQLSFQSLTSPDFLFWENDIELINSANKIISNYFYYSKLSSDLFTNKHSEQIYNFYLNKLFN